MTRQLRAPGEGRSRVGRGVAGLVLALVGGLALGSLAVVTAPAYAAAEASARAGKAAGRSARPVLARSFPDPTVVRFEGRFVAVGTGPRAPRATAPTAAGPWRASGKALGSLPRWARNGSVWASDLVPGPDGWLLYFSALVRGLGPDGRCIGVATAPSPLASFTPSERPLVCPSAARGRAGSDPVNPPGVPTPAGVIDADGYTTEQGRRLLTYRTQGLPATIRVVPLNRRGTAARPGAFGVPLVASTGVIENPVLLRRGRTWVLLTSEGYFGGCGYSTTYRRAKSLGGLATAPRRTLMQRSSTGLCGPGGADLAGTTMFFHAWTCPTGRSQCRGTRDYHRKPRFAAERSLFAAELRFSRSGRPRIASYVAPAVDPDVVNADGEVVPQDPAQPEPDGPGETPPPAASPTTSTDSGLLGTLLGILGPG